MMQCDRNQGDSCALCQKAGAKCGPSLNAKEARALTAQLKAASELETMKEADVGGKGLPQMTCKTDTAVFDQICSKITDMFDRTQLGEDLNKL